MSASPIAWSFHIQRIVTTPLEGRSSISMRAKTVVSSAWKVCTGPPTGCHWSSSSRAKITRVTRMGEGAGVAGSGLIVVGGVDGTGSSVVSDEDGEPHAARATSRASRGRIERTLSPLIDRGKRLRATPSDGSSPQARVVKLARSVRSTFAIPTCIGTVSRTRTSSCSSS